MAKRSSSSHRWLARQRKDPYVRQAQADGEVSRAHFKLQQLDERFKLLRRGQRILELGAAPGGWTRYLAERIGHGLIIACDPRPMTVPGWVQQVNAPFGEPEGDRAVAAALADEPLDLVLSDMAPNISGVKAADQALSMGLADLAALAAEDWLSPGGHLVVKLFQGAGVDEWVAEQRHHFRKVQLVKPAASRPGSREVYAVALGRLRG